MRTTHTRSIHLAGPATGTANAAWFTVREVEVPAPGAGELALRPLIVSVDPYLMMPLRNGAFGDGPVRSRIIAVVEQSEAPGYAPGDIVLGFAPWQERMTMPANEMRIIRPVLPLPAYLGLAGHSGFTAMVGMDILDPQPGQTVTISSAAGMVGLVAAQLAKAAGARVVAIAGGDKARRVADLFGLDGAVDHVPPDLAGRLAAACPAGIDRHFENVGAKILDPVFALANRKARIALCGMIQHYGDEAPICFDHFRKVLLSSIQILPFSIYDEDARQPADLARLEDFAQRGLLHAPETIHAGFEGIVPGFLAMLHGDGIGKHLVRLGES
ncbi:MAG TPA: NADP-dependent oxidoreductase [Novosphingobium sp.]